MALGTMNWEQVWAPLAQTRSWIGGTTLPSMSMEIEAMDTLGAQNYVYCDH